MIRTSSARFIRVPVATIFERPGLHVLKALKITLAENLDMIEDPSRFSVNAWMRLYMMPSIS